MGKVSVVGWVANGRVGAGSRSWNGERSPQPALRSPLLPSAQHPSATFLLSLFFANATHHHYENNSRPRRYCREIQPFLQPVVLRPRVGNVKKVFHVRLIRKQPPRRRPLSRASAVKTVLIASNEFHVTRASTPTTTMICHRPGFPLIPHSTPTSEVLKLHTLLGVSSDAPRSQHQCICGVATSRPTPMPGGHRCFTKGLSSASRISERVKVVVAPLDHFESSRSLTSWASMTPQL